MFIASGRQVRADHDPNYLVNCMDEQAANDFANEMNETMFSPRAVRRLRLVALLKQDVYVDPEQAEKIAKKIVDSPHVDIRSALYRALCDKWLIAAMAYRELGQTAKAAAALQQYKDARAAIAEEFADPA